MFTVKLTYFFYLYFKRLLQIN